MSPSAFSSDEVLRAAADYARPEDQVRLHAVLRSAAAPARSGELDGEAAAMAAFRSAAARRPASLKVRVAKLLTVKMVALAAAVLSVGGVAVAASAGALPGPLGHGPASADQPAPQQLAPKARPGRPASSPAALVARCHDYLGRGADDRRRALDGTDFHELVVVAGGKEHVENYCGALLRNGGASATVPPGSAPPASTDPGASRWAGRSPGAGEGDHSWPHGPGNPGTTPTPPDAGDPSADPTLTPSSDENHQASPPTEAG
jgi:hypothetical protein